jgi:acylphosphatase
MNISISVKGLVQGVFYRSNTERVASELGLKGWVKNESDGSVSILAQGEKEQLDKLVEWCHKGPDASRVDSVSVTELENNEDLSEFHTEY